ncbi:chromosome segregation protein SMC [Candidatus Avelusimicrobium facis]|uniref:chromosome segregation protein SMC n=1 Tax=Candidatus Avelusimicrobium facis TaxID=3416203 RepID=UPI003D138802
MYLKAIEIVGFKSFADKMRLDFEPGITCVVGPNGCGKSNVIDSVRWTIGEMSWKALRSASMVDIIFNGTAKRAPLNMAQVSMVFDNSTRNLPLDFNEITVSRKIFRSGESEYYLNKVQCRLRDIRDLFLDTGIGGEGYAIIDQGGVESVLSATPEQRREMFEEVAGVSKYKAKREECIRRLERVDMDLARLSDTVVLIAEQIKKLDGEARKARLYQKYREELKESEIAISLCSIKEADGLIAKHGQELQPVLARVKDIETQISAQEGQTAAMDLNLTHKQKEVAEFNEKIAASKYQVGLLEGALQNCDNLTAEFTAQLAASGTEAQRGQNRIKEIEPAIAKLKAQLAELDGQLAPLQKQYNEEFALSQRQEQQLREADGQIQRASNDLMRLVQSQMECQNKIALEQANVQRENEDLITLEKRSQADSGVDGVRKALEEIRARLSEKQNAAKTAREQISQGEEHVKNLQQKRNALNEQLSAVRSEKAALNTKLEMIRTQGENDPYWVGVKTACEAGIPGIQGTLRKALKYPAELSTAVEEAFGKYLDAVLCENETAARVAADRLKAHGKARCKFILLDKVPAAAEASGSLKGQLKYAAGLENLVRCLIGGYHASADGALQGGFFLSAGAPGVSAPEAYWGEEEAVKETLREKTAQKDALSKEIIGNYEALQKADEALRALRTAAQEAAVAAGAVQGELSSKERELKQAEEALARAAAQKQELMTRVERRKQNVQQLQSDLQNLLTQQEELKTRTENVKTQKAQLQKQTEQAKSRLNQLNGQLYELKIRKNNVEVDLKSTEFEYNTLLQNEGKRAEAAKSASARLQALAQEKLSTQAKLSTERDTLAKLETDEYKLRQSLEALKKDYNDKMTALNANKKQVSELHIKQNDLENALANARRQRTTVVNNLFESWNITPEEAQLNFGDKQVDYERVKMMRKRIENMGAVNMTAPEEYDALTERHDFLKSQINDLDEAKKDLRSAIHKINVTTRDNFKYTFEQVRMHFKNIYQTLFRGGDCNLVLTEPENLLETGIEIYAQPPGKKLLNISSMSGGEKTLTALSLLFAFFTHNPAPFCIMDEADAALDEANVERFVNLIKEFSNSTQFIVVTHNKRTMESARRLYGITMEESGVSKVMSVNLADRADQAKKEELEAMAVA